MEAVLFLSQLWISTVQVIGVLWQCWKHRISILKHISALHLEGNLQFPVLLVQVLEHRNCSWDL